MQSNSSYSLCPEPSTKNLCVIQPLGIWHAPSNMVWESSMWDGNLYRQNVIDPRWHYERHVAVHLPEAIPTKTLTTIFDNNPAMHSAMVQRLAVPADVSRNLVYTADFMSLEYPLIPPSKKTFEEWRGQLLHIEKRLLHFITYKSCDTEKDLIKYLQLDCIIYIGTDGGKREHGGSFSWIICSPGRKLWTSGWMAQVSELTSQ